ncbi:hypothetical protein AWC38_SpisGene22193 [Stylophora pistillata]|uniref:Uncharacterized protein n=1 Tax=Stylophora pistillata TaxID=50429 RepID=A0A2B4RB19_STYPI|nr:hypothetical protein AWC38_SpisGene22193 [Stylophora pistillata]
MEEEEIKASNSHEHRSSAGESKKRARINANNSSDDEDNERNEGKPSEIGSEFTFSVSQMRTKFKKLLRKCKGATMTIKTAIGIKRFQEKQGYGKWFQALYALVKTRDSCQPEQAHEPSATTPPPQEDSHENSSSADSQVYTYLCR